MPTILKIAPFLLVALFVAGCDGVQRPSSSAVLENAYERVMRTGELRCGYFSWNPALIKDPNTGVLSGTFYEYMEELGRALQLKIVWAQEIGLGDYPPALNAGRIDAMCGGIFATSARARAVDFITPAYYVPLHAYARIDDDRFQGFNVDKFNDVAYKVAILEGGVTSIIRALQLPKTQVYELPQTTSPSELFMSLAQGKADFVLFDLFTFEDYSAHNPGKLKRVSDTPIKVFPLAAAVGKNQDALREMLSTATMDLHLAGTIDKILTRYEKYPDTLIRIKMQYQQ